MKTSHFTANMYKLCSKRSSRLPKLVILLVVVTYAMYSSANSSSANSSSANSSSANSSSNTVQDGVIYNFSGDFMYGLAIPGEECLTGDLEKTSLAKVFEYQLKHEMERHARHVVKNICGRWLGYYCDKETLRCDCKGSNMTWEKEPLSNQGCHVLVNQTCGVQDVYTNFIHDCVNGAVCNDTTKLCDCVYPGLSNCTAVRKIPIESASASKISSGIIAVTLFLLCAVSG